MTDYKERIERLLDITILHEVEDPSRFGDFFITERDELGDNIRLADALSSLLQEAIQTAVVEARQIGKLVDKHIEYTDNQQWAEADRTAKLIAQLQSTKEEE